MNCQKRASNPCSSFIEEMFPKTVLLYFCLIIVRQCVETATVVEVPVGHLAELPCLSNDDNHRFMFWQLIADKDIVGPGNDIDQEKYNYEVLTGKLYIKGVSTAEEGFYRCVSRGLQDDADIKIHIVELIVKKNSALAETSFETKLLTGMTATTVIVVGIAVILLVLLLKRRHTQDFFDFEQSRENSPARYTRSAKPNHEIPTSKNVESGGLDNLGMEVDFPRVFQQMQKGNVI